MLLLQVQRRRGRGGRFSRHAVQLEAVLTLPGHDRYELAAPHASRKTKSFSQKYLGKRLLANLEKITKL